MAKGGNWGHRRGNKKKHWIGTVRIAHQLGEIALSASSNFELEATENEHGDLPHRSTIRFSYKGQRLSSSSSGTRATIGRKTPEAALPIDNKGKKEVEINRFSFLTMRNRLDGRWSFPRSHRSFDFIVRACCIHQGSIISARDLTYYEPSSSTYYETILEGEKFLFY